MLPKQRFVLDTSAFTTGGSQKEIEEKIDLMVALIATAKKAANISCYVPPSVWEELEGMLERKNIPREIIRILDAWTIQKAPSRFELTVPSEFIYEYIGEVRERFNRGLRAAEKAVMRKGAPAEDIIKELRESYRTAIRKGLVDSHEDLDVLMLAKELGAGIVAKDEGIMRWAKNWGIRFIDSDSFPRLLEEYIHKSS